MIYGDYQPRGIVKQTTPLLRWNVRSNDGQQIGSVELSINGKKVKAEYNSEKEAVEYRPNEGLDAGLYKVVCRATIPGQVTARQDWTFEVNPAGEDAPIASALALDEINLVRKELGLPSFRSDQRANDAAMAHSRYMSQHGVCGHVESADKPGFTGVQPWDRLQAFGYQGTCYEDSCIGEGDPRAAVRLLFDAPYHRIAFLQPGSSDIGVGMIGGALTTDFIVSDQSGVSTSPSDGQNDIPLSWDGNESPSPLRIHGVSGEVGYPIVFGYFSPNLESIRISSFEVKNERGDVVPGMLNTPANDPELRFAAVFLPSATLAPSAKYRVFVKAKTRSGKSIDRAWTFTTRATGP